MPDKLTRNLPVRLSDDELRARSDDLAKAEIDRVQLETKKSAESSNYNKQIKESKIKIAELSQAISSRQEYRDVEIEDRRNEETYMIETWRLDNNEKISERAMNSQERQIQLFPVGTARPNRRRGGTGEDAA
jgi:hypothetical protein